MRISTLEFFQQGLTSLLNQQKSVNELQNKISLGKRIITPSDDPVGATRALILNQSLETLDRFLKNGDTAQSNLEAEDAALQTANRIYQRIHELAVQGGNPINSSSDRQSIAAEIEQRLFELQGIANTKNPDGAYMFSGTKGGTQAVALNAQGQYVFQGDDTQQTINLGASTIIATSDSAKDIFFLADSETIKGSSLIGTANQVAPSSGLVASGSLSTLDLNELKLNNTLISPSKSDGVSTTDAQGSALAIANAINLNRDTHKVQASADPNVFNLGTITPGVLTSGDFTLNGVAIVDATGSESSTLASLQAAAEQTGVSVSQPGGPGTDIILTANDGRNLQLQTDGTSASTFSNFNLNGGALDQVQRSSLTLTSHQNFSVGGSSPADVGLTAGPVSMSLNTGTGTISPVTIYDTPSNLNDTYSIIFNAGGTTFDVVRDSDRSTPLEGFDDITFVPGQAIEFEGIRVSIEGTPNAGDTFGVTLQKPAKQDVFTTIQNLVSNLRSTQDSDQLSYEIGVALSNLSNAETRVLEVRAQVGARLNIVESQRDVNETTKLLNQNNLSDIQDLDFTEALSTLSLQSFALEAAQQSYIRIQSLSIFNFLR